MLVPGPNVAQIVSTSVEHGARYGLVTVLGTSSAMVIQLVLTAFGMRALLDELVGWFGPVRWLGVAYLAYLGVRQWRAESVDVHRVTAMPKAARSIYLRGLFISLTNPKTLLFFGAFFPQFVAPGPHAHEQLALLSVSFLCVALCFDCAWALLAARARRFLGRPRLRNRVSGTLLVGAALGLALARRK
jgi:threonine/homoserine/homoserine lactone efflux protein